MDFNFPQKQGTGIEKLIPHVSPDCRDLIVQLLRYNQEERISARQALKHAYFADMAVNERPMRSVANASPTFSRHSGAGDNESENGAVERKPGLG
jgi:renal tumor antigen